MIIFLALLSVWGVLYHLEQYSESAFNLKAMPQKIIVEPGQGVYAISKKLHLAKIICYPMKFRLYARLKKLDTRIKAGEYLLSGAMTPSEVLHKLIKGSVVLYRLTIPEGYTMVQIADLVEKAGILKSRQFLDCLQGSALLKKLQIPSPSFEGYLFPDTYYFPRGVSSEKVVTTLVSRFWEVFKPAWRKRADELGWTVHDVVTLAAMIEKETGDPDERPVISSVFHNRLKKRMRMESDPTVIYGIKNFDGNITRKHLRTPSPYNTYLLKGLPAGPIANPGAKAIEAALYPDNTNYLYFVSKKNQTHHFSTTIQEHNRAVRKYQLRRR